MNFFPKLASTHFSQIYQIWANFATRLLYHFLTNFKVLYLVRKGIYPTFQKSDDKKSFFKSKKVIGQKLKRLKTRHLR